LIEVSISGGAGAVTNSGVITGGVSLGAGGSVTNADGAAISGASRIVLSGFSLSIPAVDISGGAGTVTNSGFLGHGVELHAGGSLTNAEGAVISVGVPSAYDQFLNLVGVSVYGSPGTIVNVGTIESLGGGYRDGVYLGSGGIVTNSGTIAGHHGGILVEGAASTLFNDGRIAATGSYGIGVYLGSVGNTLVNDGRIAATGSYGTGVYIRSDGDTLVNAGRIGSAGGTAVYLAGGYNDLVVQQGAVFVGKVEAAGSYDTLELAGSRGRLDGLGTKFSGFYNVVVDPGAVWTLSGSAPAIDDDGTLVAKGNDLTLGQIVSDPGDKGHITVDGTATFAGAVGAQELVFNAAGTMRLDHPLTFKGTITEFDTIDLVNQAANGFSFAHHRVSDRLSVTENGATVADLHLRGYGGYASADFTLSSDGHSGTDITFTPPPIIGL
ncbi:MAG: hypothetical protein ACREFK_08040, partial [Stellaceae bacterium]